MNKKQIIEVLGGVLIAAIFISSYISLANYGGSQNQTQASTTINAQTVFASGTANATITGYYPTFAIYLQCKNATLDNSTIDQLSNTLTNLENNNNVSNFYPLNKKIIVNSGSSNSIALYSYLSPMINQSAYNCTVFSGSASIELPSAVKMKVQTQVVSIPIPGNLRNSSLSLNFSKNISGQVPVKVSALLYLNGSIAGSMEVSRS